MRKWLVVPLAGAIAIGGYFAYAIYSEPLNEQRMSCFMYEQSARLEEDGIIPGRMSAQLLADECTGQSTNDITSREMEMVCTQLRSEQYEDPRAAHIYERLLEPCPLA